MTRGISAGIGETRQNSARLDPAMLASRTKTIAITATWASFIRMASRLAAKVRCNEAANDKGKLSRWHGPWVIGHRSCAMPDLVRSQRNNAAGFISNTKWTCFAPPPNRLDILFRCLGLSRVCGEFSSSCSGPTACFQKQITAVSKCFRFDTVNKTVNRL